MSNGLAPVGASAVQLDDVNQLPPALQASVPILAADGGRQRARTMLAILMPGIDYVDQRLDPVDRALGSTRPGRLALASLVAATRTATSLSGRTVRNQHVISQVVLRQFVEATTPQPGAGQ
ncbi:MAG TPA: hypothetical protein VMW47_10950 [Verrucomicrobiae bacterium]|nr:hypothetical protein [Verrucomicrobiae bacterium]